MYLLTGIARIARSGKLLALLFLAVGGPLAAQTDPVPQPLPHAQNFSATLHGSSAYPTGWQGWRIGTAASSAFEVGAPTADLALIASSTAAVNTGGLHNYNGALGVLNSGTTNAALVLSISMSAHHNVEVGYTLSTIRDPYNGTTNTRINEATVQYRVGTTGPFTTLAWPVYATGTTTQTGAVTTPLDPVSFSGTLPTECDYQPIVQLRWVIRDGAGIGARASIAVDDVSVDGTSFPMFMGGVGDGSTMDAHMPPGSTALIFTGGNGRGDVSDSYTPPVSANIFSGGNGRGDVSNGYSTPPVSASIFTGGNGRGDVSNGYTTPPLTASIFNGGNGRGDVSNGYTTPPLSASIFSGGNGRGDGSNGYATPPLTASIFNGGNGRGDVSHAYANTVFASNIFSGGNGRGDVSNAVLLFTPLGVTTILTDETLCTGLPFEVVFTTTDTFNAGNTFTAQLSDDAGDFTNAVDIGSIAATTSDTIVALIPSGTLENCGYLIRVVGNDPAVIGADNGAYLDVLDGSTDTDGDGTPDCMDACPGLAYLSVDGDPCDDGDPTTINDVVSSCACQGCTPARFSNDQGYALVCEAASDFTYTCGNLTVPGEFTSAWSFNGVDLGQPNTVVLTAPDPGPGEHTYLLVAGNTCGADTFYLHVSVQSSFNAGSDTSYTTCNGTGWFHLNSLLSPDADLGGSWYSVDYGFDNGPDPVFVAFETTAGTYTYWYNISLPGCVADTAVVTVNIYDGVQYVYYDSDLDGYGAPEIMTTVCDLGPGYSLNGDDCDDTDADLTVMGNACDDGDASTVDDTITDQCQCIGTPALVLLEVRALLDGPYDPGTGLMHDSLRVHGLIPFQQPYSALGFALSFGGAETVPPAMLNVTGSDAIVDWVVVELRDATDPAIVTAAHSLLVQRDGDIVDPNTGVNLLFAVASGNYHITVRHRNHVGVMTAAPVLLNGPAVAVDFSLPSTPTFGIEARRTNTGRAALWSGDVNRDGSIMYTGAGNDRDPVLLLIGGSVPTNVVTGLYTTEDVNLDGQVKYIGQDNDRDPILVTIGGSIPTNVRMEQLP